MKKVIIALSLVLASTSIGIHAADRTRATFQDEISSQVVQAMNYQGMDQVRAFDRVLQKIERSNLSPQEKSSLYENVARKLRTASREMKGSLTSAQAEELEWVLQRVAETEIGLAMASGEHLSGGHPPSSAPGFFARNWGKMAALAVATLVVVGGAQAFSRGGLISPGRSPSGKGGLGGSSARGPSSEDKKRKAAERRHKQDIETYLRSDTFENVVKGFELARDHKEIHGDQFNSIMSEEMQTYFSGEQFGERGSGSFTRAIRKMSPEELKKLKKHFADLNAKAQEIRAEHQDLQDKFDKGKEEFWNGLGMSDAEFFQLTSTFKTNLENFSRTEDDSPHVRYASALKMNVANNGTSWAIGQLVGIMKDHVLPPYDYSLTVDRNASDEDKKRDLEKRFPDDVRQRYARFLVLITDLNEEQARDAIMNRLVKSLELFIVEPE